MIKSMSMRWAGHVASMGILMGNPIYGWEDNIQVDLKEIG
jgi:hypothetical protein